MSQYHNALKKRIKTDQVVFAEKVEAYKKVGECVLVHFNRPPFVQFIRPHSYWRYEGILEVNNGQKI